MSPLPVANGVRLTRQRQVVLDTLGTMRTHPEAMQVFHAVRERMPNISLATVYRTLGVLRDAGLVREFVTHDGPRRYDATPGEHFHLACRSCGRLVDVELPEAAFLGRRAAEVTLFSDIEVSQVELTGICPECAAPSGG